MEGWFLKPELFLRGFLGRCPRCGKGPLFSGFLKLAPRCTSCHADFSGIDPADGPAAFSVLLGGVCAVGFAFWIETAYTPSFWVHGLVTLPISALLCMIWLRPIKGIMAAMHYGIEHPDET
jgi:uncharacterized protein (DUF983 family)